MHPQCSADSPYTLSRHVYLCIHDQDLVFLDLRRDKYLTLEAAETAALKIHVPGWPVGSTLSTESPHRADDDRPLLNELLRRGLLTNDSVHGKQAKPDRIETATREWTCDNDEEHFHTRPTELIALLISAMTAAAVLRYRPIEKVVERVRSRKALSSTRPRAVDERTTRRLVTIFARLSPMFVSTKNACLYECLALVEFLAWHRIYPTWVFGVQTRPFAAHCWTQHGDTLLNDTMDRTGRYTPIMAI